VHGIFSILGFLLLFGLSGCDFFNFQPKEQEDPVLNLYNWAYYIPLEVLEDFEKETGIRVQLDTYDSNELLEAKLLTGHSGYDIVCPTAFPYLGPQIEAGVYQKLNRDLLPNWHHLDPELMKKIGEMDPGNLYALPYLWGTGGFGYNKDCIKKLGLEDKVNQLAMLFDPAIASRVKDYGFSLLDSPHDVFPAALMYLGLDPNSTSPEDLEKAGKVILKVRPYISQFNSLQFVSDLANGSVCVAQSWSGDTRIAAKRAIQAGNGVRVGFSIPQEGAEIWCDVWAIPSRAPHPKNAHKFLNYLLEPKIMGRITNEMSYANGNRGSLPYIKESLRTDPMIYPAPEVRKKLYVPKPYTPQFERLANRLWTHIKTNS
jgi:putrescine transport system substrate-binding protein